MRKNRIDENALHAEPLGTGKTILVLISTMAELPSLELKSQTYLH